LATATLAITGRTGERSRGVDLADSRSLWTSGGDLGRGGGDLARDGGERALGPPIAPCV
jgi:hypothetical protein